MLGGLGSVPGLVAALAVLVKDLPGLGAFELVIEFKATLGLHYPY